MRQHFGSCPIGLHDADHPLQASHRALGRCSHEGGNDGPGPGHHCGVARLRVGCMGGLCPLQGRERGRVVARQGFQPAGNAPGVDHRRRPRVGCAQGDRPVDAAQRTAEQARAVVGQSEVVQRRRLEVPVTRRPIQLQALLQAAQAHGQVHVAASQPADGTAFAAAVAGLARQRDGALDDGAVFGCVVALHQQLAPHAQGLAFMRGVAQGLEVLRGCFGLGGGGGRVRRLIGQGLAQQGQRHQFAAAAPSLRFARLAARRRPSQRPLPRLPGGSAHGPGRTGPGRGGQQSGRARPGLSLRRSRSRRRNTR